MAKLRVLVVDDSITARNRLCEVVAADPELELVAAAENGKAAIERCTELRPDVITMDMMMPVMTGVAATEYIMAYCPTPILIVSSSTNRGELFRTYDALAAGAVDVLEKPRGDEPGGTWETRFLSTLKLVARIRVITHLRGRQPSRVAPQPPPARIAPSSHVEIIGIGASTGGPAAIVEVLRRLPPRLPIPVLFVLHLSDRFGGAFAEWLDAQTEHEVRFARDGELVAATAGRIVMAPPDRHLVVLDGKLCLTDDAERHSCRPSVDVLFESLARAYGSGAAGCLLTGMGRDGAAGLLAIRAAGGATIAQDEATCVVFGMPHEAIAIGAAVHVHPIHEIGPALAALVSSPRAGQR
jgi:two-component system, chemotaxis family, protein-glutamate methylesterase/glutaminase